MAFDDSTGAFDQMDTSVFDFGGGGGNGGGFDTGGFDNLGSFMDSSGFGGDTTGAMDQGLGGSGVLDEAAAGGGNGFDPNWQNVAAGVLGIGGGLFNLMSNSPFSGRGAISNAAQVADPFAPQRGQYQQLLQQQMGMQLNTPKSIDFGTAMGSAAPWARMPELDPRLGATAGNLGMNGALMGLAGASADPSALLGVTGRTPMDAGLAKLSAGSDPSTQFRFQTGLDAATRGAAATGFLGSGEMMKELTDYGQNFASTEFANQFQRQTNLQQLVDSIQQQNYTQQLGTFGAMQNKVGQTFNQESTLQQLLQSMQGQNFGQLGALSQMEQGRAATQFQQTLQGAGFEQAGVAQQTQAQQQQNQLLALLAGANTSSPAQAGSILGGQYQNTQNAQGQIGAGVAAGGGGGGGGGGSNIWHDAAGIIGGLGMIFSDIRLKDNIEHVGETPEGLPLYTYNYKWDDKTEVGPLAHEVMRFFPEAVKMHPSGFLQVDYSKVA